MDSVRGFLLLTPSQSSRRCELIKTITANVLKQRLENNEVLLIDVREVVEHAAECIEHACLIPLSEFSLDKLPSLDKPIVIHCRSGMRSEEACKILLSQDPSLEVYNLEGGILAWKKVVWV